MRPDDERPTAAAPSDWTARAVASAMPLPEAEDVPGYRLVALIHRGGQGAVYRAVQLSTGREVAVKVLSGGRHAMEVERRRFERESDLVALLDHPNVVALIDRGEANGQLFLVMHLVEGEDLDAWALRAQPSLPEKLRVFLAACSGVTHAHQRGVIHRDLKPRNIRVDASGQAHVLDFGLGKPFDELTGPDASSLTMDGHFIGTLAFAAPEQLSGEHSRTDVRTDVHALGLVLYWLLTNRMPYKVSSDISDVLRAVRFADPEPPRSHVPGLDLDLQTIVLKALAKEPDRRYQTVDALATDLRRHLAGEPIDARRDSRWYVLRKTAHRYRVAVAAALVFMSLLVAAIVGVSLQRNEALRQGGRAEAALEQLKIEAEKARTEAESADRISRVLAGMLKLTGDIPGSPQDLRVVQLLDRARDTVLPPLADDPVVRARVAIAIANAYVMLGRHADAAALGDLVRPLVDAGDAKPGDRIDASRLLARLVKGSGDSEGAEPHHRKALELARAHDGELPLVVLPGCLANLATNLIDQGRVDEAAGLLEEAVELTWKRIPDDKFFLAQITDRLAYLKFAQGRHEESLRLKRESRTLFQEHFHGPNLLVAGMLSGEAGSLTTGGKPEEGEALARESIAMFLALEVPEHVQAAEARNHLGLALKAQRSFDEAEAEFRESLRIFRKSAGEDVVSVGVVLQNLAELEDERGHRMRALELWADVVAWHEARTPVNEPALAHAREKLLKSN